MKKFGFLFVTSIVLFSGVIILSITVTRHLQAYYDQKMHVAEELDFKNRMLDVWEYVPFTSTAEEKVELWQETEQACARQYTAALTEGLLLLILVALFVLVNLSFYRKKPHRIQVYGLVMVFASFSFLYLGLQSPFLEIEAFNRDLTISSPIDFTYEGRVYYFYQNKSVFQLIGLLYTGGNFLVALCVLLASIIFPVTKLIASAFVFFKPESNASKRIIPLISNLGKWSMADVFVASIFLAYFSFSNMNTGVETGSQTLIGTYFFLCFVVTSIASGFVFKNLVGKID